MKGFTWIHLELGDSVDFKHVPPLVVFLEGRGPDQQFRGRVGRPGRPAQLLSTGVLGSRSLITLDR